MKKIENRSIFYGGRRQKNKKILESNFSVDALDITKSIFCPLANDDETKERHNNNQLSIEYINEHRKLPTDNVQATDR
jgi:hypothetical protein